MLVILLYFDRHCPTLSQPFTKRVLLDQHIQLMHGDQEGKSVNSDNIEASSDKKTVLWHTSTDSQKEVLLVNCF